MTTITAALAAEARTLSEQLRADIATITVRHRAGEVLTELLNALPAPAPLSPDCAEGKHHACTGDAWNYTLDELTTCTCECGA